MVKYFLTKDNEQVWHGRIIDDSEGTIGQSRQITRFRERVDPAIIQFVTKNEKFLFSGMDNDDETIRKFGEELTEILSKNHFKTSEISLKIDPDKLKRRLGILFVFESTEE